MLHILILMCVQCDADCTCALQFNECCLMPVDACRDADADAVADVCCAMLMLV